jgi:hypothetical protein
MNTKSNNAKASFTDYFSAIFTGLMVIAVLYFFSTLHTCRDYYHIQCVNKCGCEGTQCPKPVDNTNNK